MIAQLPLNGMVGLPSRYAFGWTRERTDGGCGDEQADEPVSDCLKEGERE